MFYIVAVEDSQLNSAANTVVCTKCCAFSCKPLAVNVCLDSICLEVDVNVYKLVAYHVHVALKAYHRSILVPLGGRLSDNDVASLVYLVLKVALLGKLLKILNHLLLVLRRTRNLVDFSKLLEYASRFQFAITHFFLISLC